MGAEKDIIVAVELGSTSIRAIAGKKQINGDMQVLAFAEVQSVNAIRKGTIDNIDKTSQAISSVVKRLSDQLEVEIVRVYVGLGGQSMHAEHNTVCRNFPEKTKITNVIVDNMRDSNSSVEYPNSHILEVVPQEYRIGMRAVNDPVGMMSEQLEIDFLNVVARHDLSENIETCVRNAGLELVEILNAPLCLAECQLSSSERHSGCALINIGAHTTTVSVYKNDILRHLAVLPLGGENATADIATEVKDMDESEALKCKYGTAYHEDTNAAGQPISISYNRKIMDTEVKNYTAARYEEIICNVGEQLKGHDGLISGLALTGGGSLISNIEEAFKQYIKWNGNVIVRKGLPANVQLAPGVTLPHYSQLHTLIALLQKGDRSCAVEPAPIIEPVIVEPETPVEPEPVPEKPEGDKDKKPKKSSILTWLKKTLEPSEDE